MRVTGDSFVDTVIVEPYLPGDNLVEVRVRENINPYIHTNPISGETYKGYTCDEYVFHVPSKENLKEEIIAHFDEWIESGRASEINENATLIQEMMEALETLGVEPYDLIKGVR